MSEQITRRDFLKTAGVAFGGFMLLGVPEIEYDARESTTVLSSTLLNGSGMVVVIDNATQNARVLTGKLVTTTDNETGEQIIGLENSFESSVATAATYFYTAEEMARSRANGYELESATAIPFPVSNDTGLIGKNVKTREEAESVMEKIQILINDHQEGAAAVEGKLIIYKYVGSKGVAYSTEILIGSGFDGPEVAKMEFTRLEPLPGNESKIVDSSTPTVRIRARRNGSINTESSLSPDVVSGANEFFGDGFEVTSKGKVIDKNLGKEISEFTIVPFDEKTMINHQRPSDPKPAWALQRNFKSHDGASDLTEYYTQYSLTVEDGKIDLFGAIYEKGEFTRQKIEFAAPNGGTVEIDGYSPVEVQYMISTNSSEDPKYRLNSPEALRQMAIKYIPKNREGGQGYITYKGMREPYDDTYWYYGTNFMPILNSDGKWSAVETTEYLVFPEFKDRSKALVIWVDKNGNPIIVVMKGKYLEMPKYFNPYWINHDIEDPFNP